MFHFCMPDKYQSAEHASIVIIVIQRLVTSKSNNAVIYVLNVPAGVADGTTFLENRQSLIFRI